MKSTPRQVVSRYILVATALVALAAIRLPLQASDMDRTAGASVVSRLRRILFAHGLPPRICRRMVAGPNI